MFQDEAGFGRINRLKHCWCRRGFVPVCPVIIFVSIAMFTVLLIRYLVIAASSFFHTVIQFV